MTTEILTQKYIEALSPSTSQYEIHDMKATGLAIRVSPGGAKSFVYLYRIGQRSRRLTLGRHPLLGLAEAREKALQASKHVQNGKDPQAQKQLDRASHTSTLFPAISALYIDSYAKQRTRSWRETKRILKRDFESEWRNIPVESITKKHVTSLIRSILSTGGPSAANHAFAIIRLSRCRLFGQLFRLDKWIDCRG